MLSIRTMAAAGVGCSLLASAALAQTVSINTPALNLSVNQGNSAISSVRFNSVEFFRLGAFISDFGGQAGSVFRRNDAGGNAGMSSVSNASVAGGGITGLVQYASGGTTVQLGRSYDFVGTNVIRVTTTVTNVGSSSVANFRIVDTFDPDQGLERGNGFSTFNDVFDFAGTRVGQATELGGYTVLMGAVSSPDYRIASGSPFAIDSSSAMNSFFASPFDGNGGFADSGLHVGFQFSGDLLPGQSRSFSYLQAYGTTASAAQAAFAAAIIPLPPAALAGVGTLCGLGALSAFRRRRA